MNINLTEHNDVLIIHLLETRLDAFTSRELKQQMNELIDQGKTKLIVDFNQVKFMDSSGLGVLISTLKNLPQPNKLVLTRIVERTIIDTLRQTRMDMLFEITENIDQAIECY
jgi:anti-sigma B factor antagonist